ncbi:hypothetical protein pb186bvf_006189 [Paramecium bursaria]
MSTSEDPKQEYKPVENQIVVDSDDEMEQRKPTQKITIDHQKPVPQKPILYSTNYQELDIRFKKQWQDRFKEADSPKYLKSQMVDIHEPILFTVDKQETKHGRPLFTKWFGSDYRYIYILDGYLYILALKNEQLFTKSNANLQRLFKIICHNSTITFCFQNKELDKRKPPLVIIQISLDQKI